MTHHHIAVLSDRLESDPDNVVPFKVQTDRKDPLSLQLPRRQWELMGEPERIHVAIDPIS